MFLNPRSFSPLRLHILINDSEKPPATRDASSVMERQFKLKNEMYEYLVDGAHSVLELTHRVCCEMYSSIYLAMMRYQVKFVSSGPSMNRFPLGYLFPYYSLLMNIQS